MNKLEIRQKYRDLRDDIPSAVHRERTCKLIENVLSLDKYREAKSVMIYCPIGSEIDLRELASDTSKAFYMPRMLKGHKMCAVEYRKDTVMIKNGYGIFEPCGKAYEGRIDIVLAPALVCSENGVRIGYGGGYYDRFLLDKDCTKACVVFDEFVLPGILSEKHDIAMDIIVTDKRIIKTDI